MEQSALAAALANVQAAQDQVDWLLGFGCLASKGEVDLDFSHMKGNDMNGRLWYAVTCEDN
jgi:hypothetical protein